MLALARTLAAEAVPVRAVDQHTKPRRRMEAEVGRGRAAPPARPRSTLDEGRLLRVGGGGDGGGGGIVCWFAPNEASVDYVARQASHCRRRDREERELKVHGDVGAKSHSHRT